MQDNKTLGKQMRGDESTVADKTPSTGEDIEKRGKCANTEDGERTRQRESIGSIAEQVDVITAKTRETGQG